MSERQRTTLLWAGGIALAAILVVWGYQRRADLKAKVPAWLDFHQPPDNVMADLPTLSQAESWAANRARHMSACCPQYTAGYRTRRIYAPSLADSKDSFVRAEFLVGD